MSMEWMNEISRILVSWVHSCGPGWGSTSDILEYGTESTYSTPPADIFGHGRDYLLLTKESPVQNIFYEHEDSEPLIMKVTCSFEKSETCYPALQFHLSITGPSITPQLELQHSSKIVFLNYVKCYCALPNKKLSKDFIKICNNGI
jgi:hypothetical protein